MADWQVADQQFRSGRSFHTHWVSFFRAGEV